MPWPRSTTLSALTHSIWACLDEAWHVDRSQPVFITRQDLVQREANVDRPTGAGAGGGAEEGGPAAHLVLAGEAGRLPAGADDVRGGGQVDLDGCGRAGVERRSSAQGFWHTGIANIRPP